MEVTLVLPPNPVLTTPTMYPNLGLMYLAAVLEQIGITPKVADLRADTEVDINKVAQADFIGVTSTSGDIGFAKKIAQMVWERDFGCKTIIGGAHASLAPHDCTADFDMVVVGEGEDILPELLQNPIPGIHRSERIRDLNRIPFPARHLFDCFNDSLFPGEKYGKGDKATTIIMSRGCPYSCRFCSNIHRLPVVYRNPENIRAEFEQVIANFGCRAFRVEDDNLGVNIPWLRRVAEAIGPLGLRLKGHMRTDLIKHDLIRLLKRMGFEELGLGVESNDDKVLDLIGKGTSSGDNYRAVRILKEHGVRVRVYFMSGLPGETDETVAKNMEFMKRAQPMKWTLSVFQPYFGSEVAQYPERFGVRIPEPPKTGLWNFVPPYISLDSAGPEILRERYARFRAFLESEEWRS